MICIPPFERDFFYVPLITGGDWLESAMKFFFSLPNQLTYLRILLTPVFLVLLFSPDPLIRQLSFPVYVLAALTDWYDGWLARRWGYVSRWGAFLDPLADKVLTSAALFAFLALDLVPGWTVWAIVIRDIGITTLRSYCEYRGEAFDTSKMAKTKTFAQMTVIFYILTIFIAREIEIFSPLRPVFDLLLGRAVLSVLMTLIAAITVVSGILYIIDNWSTVKDLTGIVKPPSNSADRHGPPPTLHVRLFASGLGTGYAPGASGTFGSLIGMLVYLIPGFENPIVLVAAIVVTYGLGIPAARRMEQHYGHDPAEVTIDEVLGMWVTLLFIPKTIALTVAAFFAFRVMDIIKPFPARRIDSMRGGFGIMTDDVVAGVYANILLQLLLIPDLTRSFFL